MALKRVFSFSVGRCCYRRVCCNCEFVTGKYLKENSQKTRIISCDRSAAGPVTDDEYYDG